MIKRFSAFTVIALGSCLAGGQAASVIANVSDSQSVAWANAAYKITFVGSQPGKPYITTTHDNFTQTFSGTLNSSGQLSLTMTGVDFIIPAKSTWQFCITPATTGALVTCLNIPVLSTTTDVSAQINAVIIPPVVGGGGLGSGYADSEVNGVGGAQYFRLSDNTFRCYTTSWAACSVSSGGTLTSFAAPAGSWPSWLVPTVTNSTTTPSLTVVAGQIPIGNLGSAGLSGSSPITVATTGAVACPTCNVSAASVTSVGLTLNADFAVTGSPVTSAGTLAADWATPPTGTGAMVRKTNAALVTPDLGTPSALVGTNITGTAAGLTAGSATSATTATTATTATNLGGGALGSIPYQNAAGTTLFIAGPTTSGHFFVPSWQPSGSVIAPVSLDLATWAASPPAIGGTAQAAGSFTTILATGNVNVGAAGGTSAVVFQNSVTQGVRLASGYPIYWTPNNGGGTPDVGIDRNTIGVLEINIGGGQASTGKLKLAGLYPNGSFVASGQTSATTAQTLTTTTATSTYQINAVVTCDTTVAAATVTLSVAYTDPSSTAQTVTPSAAACTALGASSSANVTQTIRAKTGTTITVAAAISGSPNYDIAATALQLTSN